MARRVLKKERRRERGGGALKGILDGLDLEEEFGGLAFEGADAEMAFQEIVGVFEDCLDRIGIGGGVGQFDLVADFEPSHVDERQADGAFELAWGVKDETSIGGGEDLQDGFA